MINLVRTLLHTAADRAANCFDPWNPWNPWNPRQRVLVRNNLSSEMAIQWLKSTGVGRFIRIYYLLNALAIATYLFARRISLLGVDVTKAEYIQDWVCGGSSYSYILTACFTMQIFKLVPFTHKPNGIFARSSQEASTFSLITSNSHKKDREEMSTYTSSKLSQAVVAI